MASAMPYLYLPHLQSITAHWPEPNYTDWWQGHKGVNNLTRVIIQLLPHHRSNLQLVNHKYDVQPTASLCHCWSLYKGTKAEFLAGWLDVQSVQWWCGYTYIQIQMNMENAKAKQQPVTVIPKFKYFLLHKLMNIHPHFEQLSSTQTNK